MVLITGGGSGIGLTTARELAFLGASVAICGRKPEKIDAGREEIAADGVPADRIFGGTCDIREPDQVAAFVAQTLERFGRIDVLINNAGGQFPSPAEGLSPRGWEAVIRNNLNGTFYMTREVATRAMIPQKRGRIVNVTAMVARGFPGMSHTGAARAGVENLTRSLAVEWAPYNIRVNAVAPGPFWTPLQPSGGLQQPPIGLEPPMGPEPPTLEPPSGGGVPPLNGKSARPHATGKPPTNRTKANVRRSDQIFMRSKPQKTHARRTLLPSHHETSVIVTDLAGRVPHFLRGELRPPGRHWRQV